MCRTASQKAIRIMLFPLICIALLVLFPNMMAYAAEPALTPAPAASQAPEARSIIDSFDVQFNHNGTWSLLKKEMISAHEKSCYSDGILRFMPLSSYVKERQIPCIKLSNDFDYHVITWDPSVSLEYSHTLYNQDWEVIPRDETPASDWSQLDSGKYLLSIEVFVSDSDRYATTASLVWLIVGDDEDGEEQMSSPTPAISPIARNDPN